MVNQCMRKACTAGLCLCLLLFSASSILLSDERTELHLLQQALSVCYTTEEQDAVVRVFSDKCPAVDSIATVPTVECGTPDVITVMRVISRLDVGTQRNLFELITEVPTLPEEKVLKSANFAIHYTLKGKHATTEDFAQKIKEIMETSYSIEISTWGYRKPSSAPKYSDNLYHVFIADIPSAGKMVPLSLEGGSIVIIDPVVGWATNYSRQLELCAHEYFHAIQETYIRGFKIKDNKLVPHPLTKTKEWVIEGTAKWMGHEVFRQHMKENVPEGGLPPIAIEYFVDRVNNYLEKPYRGLESLKHDALLFWFFVADNSRINFFTHAGSQRDFIKKFWDLMGYDYKYLTGMLAWNNVHKNLDIMLEGNPECKSLDEVFKLFVQSNYFKDVETDNPWYNKNGQFTQDMFDRRGQSGLVLIDVESVKRKHIRLQSLPVNGPPLVLKSAESATDDIYPLENYSSYYFEIENDTDKARQLKISLLGDSSLFLMVFEDAANEKSKTLIRSNTTKVCIQKGKKTVVIVGRLSGGTKKDYTLKIENGCNPEPKGRAYKEPDEAGCKELDLIFVIDVTGSMGDDIGAVKNSATAIVNTIASMICDFQVGIVAYRDHPVYPYGDPGDVMFEDYAFSKDTETIIANMNSLNVSGGADWEEAVYDALMRAINPSSLGGWREGVKKKVIILMGDAPPHNPCPFHGYTAKHVIDAAYNVDPAIIYSVCVGSDSYTYEAFKEVSEGTGGEVFTALTADDVVAALLDAVGTAIVGPEPDSVHVNVPVQPDLPPPDHNEMVHPLALENIRKAQDLQAEVDNLVKEMASQGKEIPEEMMNLIELAETCLEKAEYYGTTGNFIAANYWAIQAQELLKEVMQALQNFKFSFHFLFSC